MKKVLIGIATAMLIGGFSASAEAGGIDELKLLEKTFRNGLKLEGTPVRIELRSDANPFVKGEQQLSQKQVARKRKIKKNRKPLKR